MKNRKRIPGMLRMHESAGSQAIAEWFFDLKKGTLRFPPQAADR